MTIASAHDKTSRRNASSSVGHAAHSACGSDSCTGATLSFATTSSPSPRRCAAPTVREHARAGHAARAADDRELFPRPLVSVHAIGGSCAAVPCFVDQLGQSRAGVRCAESDVDDDDRPHASRFTSWPRLIVPNVRVTSARTSSPGVARSTHRARSAHRRRRPWPRARAPTRTRRWLARSRRAAHRSSRCRGGRRRRPTLHRPTPRPGQRRRPRRVARRSGHARRAHRGTLPRRVRRFAPEHRLRGVPAR